MNDQAQANGQDQQEQQPTIQILQIYLKDASFESPASPEIFNMQQNGAPKITAMPPVVEFKELGDNMYDVTIKASAKAEGEDDTTWFIAEVQQSGVFLLSGLAPEQLDHAINAYCPGILFPYARQAIAGLTTQGAFPACQLPPFNFDAIFFEKKQQEQQAQAAGEAH